MSNLRTIVFISWTFKPFKQKTNTSYLNYRVFLLIWFDFNNFYFNLNASLSICGFCLIRFNQTKRKMCRIYNLILEENQPLLEWFLGRDAIFYSSSSRCYTIPLYSCEQLILTEYNSTTKRGRLTVQYWIFLLFFFHLPKRMREMR